GGVIVAAAGAAAAFAVNTLSYLALIYALLRWRPAAPVSTLPREALGSAIFAGLRYVSMSPNLEKVLVRGLLFGIGASSILALLPVVALDLVAGGPLTYGFMLGAFGIGAIGGAVLNARLRQVLSSEMIIRFSFAGFALSAVIAAFSPSAVLTSAGLLVSG
ncbi:MFS transporter, partial [Rhizobium ruizarguesonis]